MNLVDKHPLGVGILAVGPVFVKNNGYGFLCVVHYAGAKVIVCQDCIPLLIDEVSLLVEYVIVIQKVLTNLKVALLNLFLGLFYRLVEPRVVYRLSRFDTLGRHYPLHFFSTEEPHQVIVHGDVEL